MQRSGRIQAVATPSLVVAAVVAFVGLVVVSIALQPPGGGRIETLEEALAWARAAVFSIGSVTFLVALIALTRSGASTPAPAQFVARAVAGRRSAGGFTLVALGDAPDDARAITDADDAADAVRIVRAWSAAHPDEHILIFSPDGEAMAFRRPADCGVRHAECGVEDGVRRSLAIPHSALRMPQSANGCPGTDSNRRPAA